VSDGEVFSASAGEFEVPVPGGSPALEAALADVPGIVLDDPGAPVLAFSSPGDCPGSMNGDCGVLVR